MLATSWYSKPHAAQTEATLHAKQCRPSRRVSCIHAGPSKAPGDTSTADLVPAKDVRLFSNVDAKMRHQPGSVIEAAALVAGAMAEMCMTTPLIDRSQSQDVSAAAGTTVGAGILGLPFVTRVSDQADNCQGHSQGWRCAWGRVASLTSTCHRSVQRRQHADHWWYPPLSLLVALWKSVWPLCGGLYSTGAATLSAGQPSSTPACHCVAGSILSPNDVQMD